MCMYVHVCHDLLALKTGKGILLPTAHVLRQSITLCLRKKEPGSLAVSLSNINSLNIWSIDSDLYVFQLFIIVTAFSLLLMNANCFT